MSAGAEHSMMFFSYRSLQHIFLSRVCVRVCFLFLDFFFVVVLLLLATHLIFAFLWAPENRHIGGVFAFFWLLEQKNTVNTDDFCASEAQNHDLWCFLPLVAKVIVFTKVFGTRLAKTPVFTQFSACRKKCKKIFQRHKNTKLQCFGSWQAPKKQQKSTKKCPKLTSKKRLAEGSLEVKLPTIWTDVKQRREESERREEQKRED